MNNETLATRAQVAAIYAYVNRHDIDKDTLVKTLSKGRTNHASELTRSEIRRFFSLYNSDNKDNEEQRKSVYTSIWKLAWTMGMIYGHTQDDYEMNKAKLNAFCKERGTVKINLSQMNLVELIKTHRQFEAMFSKWKQKHYAVQS